MKYLILNIVSILFLLLAGFIVWLDRDGWGWCIFGAIICQTDFAFRKQEKEN